ncbi:MAG: hypothetical protein H6871_04740 [Methylobacteriaceae bacterium]|nr:hypothetical protein [Methylobacteriaceae bacterium]
MSSYLETDLLRRQAKTILTLTITTLLSLVGTVTTGFLGMNLFSQADMSAIDRTLIFFAVLIPTTLLLLIPRRRDFRATILHIRQFSSRAIMD